MDSTVASNLLGVLSELGQPRIMKSTVTLQRIFAELENKIGSLFEFTPALGFTAGSKDSGRASDRIFFISRSEFGQNLSKN